ncbi:MAG: Gfo/Idh/MocA family oxidoreductase [Clostridia bacterium]|nr:Gfo/Idh/MocA family oxidoreductase [Clostridia bacterium]
MLKYGIIGFGGLGKVHYGNTDALKEIHNDVQLVAICDIRETQFTTRTATNLGEDNSSLDFSAYNLYYDADEMLEKEQLDFVIIALPTYLHDVYAIKAMDKGIHVFSEKPMAISLEKGKAMVAKAQEKGLKLMIGQCLRFWPEYTMLKELIDSKKYGNVVRAEFNRISVTPLWSWENWYMDADKSGGAALDMHVHDMDFINYAFGKPASVTSVTTNHVSVHDAITTFYNYGDKVVIATGDWQQPSGEYPFTYNFRVRFENATVEMKNGEFVIYTAENGAEKIAVPAGDAYLSEVADFVSCIKEDRESTINPATSTLVTLEMAFAEKKSADTKTTVEL